VPNARLFWHLDNTFLGATQDIHQQAIWVNAGMHTITLVDESGQQVSQRFEVLSEGE